MIIMVPILINKDVFEPSYNDLKFMVWNHNYVCTNLIKGKLKTSIRAANRLHYLFVFQIQLTPESLKFPFTDVQASF